MMRAIPSLCPPRKRHDDPNGLCMDSMRSMLSGRQSPLEEHAKCPDTRSDGATSLRLGRAIFAIRSLLVQAVMEGNSASLRMGTPCAATRLMRRRGPDVLFFCSAGGKATGIVVNSARRLKLRTYTDSRSRATRQHAQGATQIQSIAIRRVGVIGRPRAHGRSAGLYDRTQRVSSR